MRHYLFLVLFILISGSLYCSDSLYFITCCFQDENSVGFPSNYYHFTNGQFSKIGTINGVFKRVVPNLETGVYLMVADQQYIEIDETKPWMANVKSFPTNYYMNSIFWIDMGKSRRILSQFYRPKENTIIPLVFDLASGQEEVAQSVDANHWYDQGVAGYRVSKYSLFDFELNGKQASAPITQNMRSTINCTPPAYAEKLQWVLVSTSKLFVYADAHSHDRDSTEYRIQYRDTGVTNLFKVRGGDTKPRLFGDWLCATVFEKGKKHSPGYERRLAYYKEHALTRDEQIDLFGSSYWDYLCTWTGDMIDYRFESDEIYAPGIVFAYNTATKKKIELNTGEGDSEILLIKNGTIYWREFDEIYEAPLTDSSVGPKTLVVKGPPVPDIHWMFIGEESK